MSVLQARCTTAKTSIEQVIPGHNIELCLGENGEKKKKSFMVSLKADKP